MTMPRTRRRVLTTAGLAAALVFPQAGALAADDDHDDRSGELAARSAQSPQSAGPVTDDVRRQLQVVRRATAKYHDVERAEAHGYELASECVPGMGFHYLASVAEGQEELEIPDPSILVYAPRPDGSLELVAVEYASTTPATLFGQEFDEPSSDVPYYTLHAWVWEHNPDGVFTALNPRITCEEAAEDDAAAEAAGAGG